MQWEVAGTNGETGEVGERVEWQKMRGTLTGGEEVGMLLIRGERRCGRWWRRLLRGRKRVQIRRRVTMWFGECKYMHGKNQGWACEGYGQNICVRKRQTGGGTRIYASMRETRPGSRIYASQRETKRGTGEYMHQNARPSDGQTKMCAWKHEGDGVGKGKRAQAVTGCVVCAGEGRAVDTQQRERLIRI